MNNRGVNIKGNKVLIVAGVLLAFLLRSIMEDGNLVITGIAIVLAATMTSTFWEFIKRVMNYSRNRFK